MSERAKWKIGIRKLRELDAGIKQAVPDRGNIWEETTANGMGHFYTEWCNARDGVSRYRPKFFSWKEHAEYELTKERYYQLMGDDWHADKVEIEIQKLHDLTDDKMRWRHIKKLELSDLFEQEYPLNDVEAFQSSVDSAYYPTEYLTKLYEELSKPESRPCKSFKVSDHFPGYTGTIEIYEYPHKDKRYVCGADIAEGIRSDKDHDFSTFDIFRNDTRQQVVSYWGQPDPVMFADILDWMCRQYNDALLAPEDNNHGLATIERLKTLRYPKLHYYTIQRLQDGRRIEHQKAGWHASSRTKPHRDDRLADSLREAAEGHDNIKLRCRRSVAELITYVKLPNGRAGGEGSSHDDKNTSIGIANLLFDDRRPERDKKHVPPEPVKKYG